MAHLQRCFALCFDGSAARCSRATVQAGLIGLRAPAAASGLRHCSGASAAALSSAQPGNLVRFRSADGKEQWGALQEGARARVIASVLDGSSASLGAEVEIAELLPPLPVDPAPSIFIIGLNYASHAAEAKREVGKFPVFALKNPSSVVGPSSFVIIPRVAAQKPEVDYEGELAIVIGSKLKNASVEEAAKGILGVTGSNDVSARRWQGKKGGGQWSRAKSFDTFCPLGPSILPMAKVQDALKKGGSGLGVKTVLNGQVMQDGNTSDMIFTVAEIVSYLSQGTTLMPGTIILTGTPVGVGFARDPPVWLKAGDVMEVTLEGAGTLRNTVKMEE